MVSELDFDVEIVPVDIVSEDDGLATSIINTYLSESDRIFAVNIHKGLEKAKELYQKGIIESQTLIDTAMAYLKNFDVDYVEVVSLEDFEKIGTIKNEALMLIAAKTPDKKVRLIDNIEL